MLKPKQRKKKPVKPTKDDEKVEEFFIQDIDEIQSDMEIAQVIQENSNENNIDEIQNELEENFEDTFEEDDDEEDIVENIEVLVENVVDMAEGRVEE